MSRIAEVIKSQRRQHKLSQEELAAKAGLSQYQIARLESGNYG
ncbi:MAG: helix-turn-helix transcriptional regulator [Bacteroides sp.]|nr:helix-turn-helix transcriptional regulator [Bacteroides sp.]